MQKDASYHRTAIQYNEEFENFSAELSERLEHPEVARWAKAIAKQHKFHAERHKRALNKLESKPADDVETPSVEDVTAAIDASTQGFIPETPVNPDAPIECPYAEYHIEEPTGYNDKNGHHITEASYCQINGDNA